MPQDRLVNFWHSDTSDIRHYVIDNLSLITIHSSPQNVPAVHVDGNKYEAFEWRAVGARKPTAAVQSLRSYDCE
jgi:hypothetical protein